jgi:methionine synthase II (cobalamin-independent)
MQPIPIRTTVIGSYPFPGWLEFATKNLNQFGPSDVEEMIDDAVIAAIHDQLAAGLDVITDGEQTRLDFNLSFYGYIKGIRNNEMETRKFGPPAHDQRGKHDIVEELKAPNGLGAVKEFLRLKRLAPEGPVLKCSILGKCRLSTHMCFGNFKGRPIGYRSIKPMLPGFLDLTVDEIHIELANREFAEIELLKPFAEKMDVSAGIVDVKNYYVESESDIVERIRKCLRFVPAEKLSVAPDCGLSQTARWASRQKLINMVKGARSVREGM